jgi:hypothetical protein
MHHHHESGSGFLRHRIEQMLQRLDAACGGPNADHDWPGAGWRNLALALVSNVGHDDGLSLKYENNRWRRH